jgi:hypothetical protein
VGIGVDDPSEKLEVNGNIFVNDKLSVGVNPGYYDLEIN